MKKLIAKGLCFLLVGLAALALLIFVPAGTLRFPNGWLLLGVLFLPMLVLGAVLLKKDPELLRKRLSAKEEQTQQRAVVALSGLMFVAAFVLAGLTFRFGWPAFPFWASLIASAFFLAGYLVYAEVLRENAWLSRTIEVQSGQKVIDTGLYGVVRHPMYAATLMLFLSMGVILGSPFSFAVLLFYIPIIALRMKNEEKVLEEGLPGYREYKKKVKYRVIPFIW